MKIQPPGPPGPPPEPSAQGVKRDGKTVRPTGPAPEARADPIAGELRAKFRKTDLEDGVKLEAMLQTVAGERLEGKLAAMGLSSLPDAHKQRLADWLRSDPAVREMLLDYLRKVLS